MKCQFYFVNKIFHFCGYKNLESNLYGIYNITFIVKINALINSFYYSLLNIQVIRVEHKINLSDNNGCYDSASTSTSLLFSKKYLFNL